MVAFECGGLILCYLGGCGCWCGVGYGGFWAKMGQFWGFENGLKMGISGWG